MNNKNILSIIVCVIFVLFIIGCVSQAQKIGMSGNAFVSSSRPKISVEVAKLPLVLTSEGTGRLTSSGMATGLPARIWLMVYGVKNSAMAIVTQAEIGRLWYWNSSMYYQGAVSEGVEVLGDVQYQAYTHIVNSNRDPFGNLLSDNVNGQNKKWLVRSFHAIKNFDQTKIVLEYREPLPDGIENLSSLPLGFDSLLSSFAQRARDTFKTRTHVDNNAISSLGYSNDILWRYMDERFLGTVTKYSGRDNL